MTKTKKKKVNITASFPKETKYVGVIVNGKESKMKTKKKKKTFPAIEVCKLLVKQMGYTNYENDKFDITWEINEPAKRNKIIVKVTPL